MKRSRRRFLFAVCGAGGVAGVSAVRRLFGVQDNLEPRRVSQVPQHSVSKTTWALGSDVSITALHDHRRTASAAIDAAFNELERVEDLMSIYRPESQLSQLNRDRVLTDAHSDLLEVLTAAQHVSDRSGGAFDITVQPLWELFKTANSFDGLPDERSVDMARRHVDWRRVRIRSSRVKLEGKGTAITLNGIAQGFAADKVKQSLRAHGIEHALIDTGEIGAVGARPDGQAWNVAIQHPRQPDAFVSLVDLSGRCLATSGDYATPFSGDYRHNHLFDPRSGFSPEELSSVSVVAPTATEADALSTAVFVMGPRDGFRLVQLTPKADALFVLKDGRVMATLGFPVVAERNFV